MACAMSANKMLGASGHNGAVEIYHIMIADGAESTGAMPGIDVAHGDVTPGGSGRAMDDDLCDASHKIKVLRVDAAKLKPP